MAISDFANRSRASLARSLTSLTSRASKLADEHSEFIESANEVIAATVTGPGTAAALGYLETRVPNKDGTRLSLGPVPLGVLTGGATMVTSMFVPRLARTHLRIVSASHFGLVAGTYGRGYGALHLAQAKKKKAAKGKIAGEISEVGQEAANDDVWSDAELALLHG